MTFRSIAPLLLLCAAAAHAEPPPRSVTTVGSAVINVRPDQAEFRFAVQTFDADLAKAKAANDEAASSLLSFLKTDAAVDDKRVQNGYADAEPVYDAKVVDGERVRGELRGYNVVRRYAFTLTDLSKFAAVTDRFLSTPVVRDTTFSFGVGNDRELRDRARRDAAVAAREKATLLAESLGTKLGRVREIDEQPVSPYASLNRLSNIAVDAEAEPAPLGQIAIRAEVRVVFDLAD
jgi:uncharacterized protein